MNTAAYSHDYSPAAPVLPVSVALADGTPGQGTWLALVDTGADGTFVPTEILEGLQAPVVYMTNVRSHLGENLHRVAVHRVDIVLFGSLRLPGVEVVADDWGDGIILGRNVLNELRLHLDGPAETTSVEE
ncbi:MAG: aspartyl protease family protein [Anaerolineae bacterium]|jgi:predicted aspartyl protease